MKNNFYNCTATELLNYIKKEGLKVTEITKSFIARYNEVECMVKAWADYDENISLQQAHEIDRKILNNEFYKDDLLIGIPIGVKDTYNTEFFMTQRGSEIYKGYNAGNDARIIRKARDFGAIISGKTATAEFSIHHPSKTLNPHNTEHTPGTSSSGSAVAVATGMVPVAFGTQTAASTSKPASYCGIYGFKPTFGILPRTGVLKTCDSLDTLSFFSRSVDDIELLFNVLRLKGKNHPFIHSGLDRLKDVSRSQNRIAFLKSDSFKQKPEYAQNSFLELAKETEKCLGVKIDIIDIPDFLKNVRKDHNDIYMKSVSYYFKQERDEYKEKISNIVNKMISMGQKISTEKYMQLLTSQSDLVKYFAQWLDNNYDFIFTLASAGEAPLGLEYNDKDDATLIWTYLGLPTIIVPKFKGPSGMPFGFQIVSRKYNDKELIKFTKLLKLKGLIRDCDVVKVV
jgi:Asp-tRNA(Asn)/Glu-tRNA(Gln) amidotransferase A subunit family amidase